jgi:hypothetical protein
VLVAEEEHDGHRIVELVHGLEVRYFVQVAEVDRRELLDFVGDLVQDLVLGHAEWVAVAAEADADEAVFFTEDRLVDVPACTEMWEEDGTHVGVCAVCVGGGEVRWLVCAGSWREVSWVERESLMMGESSSRVEVRFVVCGMTLWCSSSASWSVVELLKGDVSRKSTNLGRQRCAP